MEKDVGGQVLRVLGIETNTVPGDSVQLTIDSRLQAASEAALTQEIGYVNNYLGHTEAFAGVAIVMNPNNGKILAMVSWPSYDNNRFARSIDFNYYTSMAGDPERNIPGRPDVPAAEPRRQCAGAAGLGVQDRDGLGRVGRKCHRPGAQDQ